MKVKSLKIEFESFDGFFGRVAKELKEAVETGKQFIQPKSLLIWSSPEAYQQFMSDQKYAILAAISKYRPQSVYKLAKILNRAQQNVARDCDLLAGHGFIKFVSSKKGRKNKAPRLSFDYNAVEVHLPSVTYKIEFEGAA